MDTRKFWKALTEEKQAELAAKAQTSAGNLYLVMYGHRRPSPELAIRISQAARELGFKIPKSVLRPDIWEAA